MSYNNNNNMSYNNSWVPEEEQEYGNPQVAGLPANLDYLPREEIVNLLKRVTSERNSLDAALRSSKKRTKTSHYQPEPPPVQVVQPWASPPAPAVQAAPFNVIATKKRIFKTATVQIKKTVHSDRNKPYTDLTDYIPTELALMSLMEGYPPKSVTKCWMTWTLNHDQILDWWNMHENPYIHPVANRIKTICFVGSKPNVYAHAAIESIDIKWERKTGIFKLKCRTFVAGTGRPPHFAPLNDIYIPPRGPNGKFAPKANNNDSNSNNNKNNNENPTSHEA
jgi:hypothetical protein